MGWQVAPADMTVESKIMTMQDRPDPMVWDNAIDEAQRPVKHLSIRVDKVS